MRVGFQGTRGAFSEEAILRALASPVEPVGHPTFRDAVRAVAEGRDAMALLPVENTLAGTVHQSYDALVAAELAILAEVVMPIRHFLMGVPGASVARLRTVRSHPVALAQCAGFFDGHPGVEAVVAFDTAGAADEVADAGDPSVAAIAPRANAARRGLEILRADLQDRDDNQTRFLLVGRGDAAAPPMKVPAGPERAVLAAEVPNRPGALARLLTRIAEEGHDLSRIDGRPTGVPWRYRFILEMTLADPSPDLGAGLQSGDEGWEVRVLGAFRRFDTAGATAD